MGWLFFLLFLVVVLRIAVTVKPSLRRPLLIGCYIVLAGILLYMFFLFGGCSGNPTRAYSGNFPGIYILILVAVAALSIGTYYFVVVSKYKKTTYYQITHNGYFKMRGDDGLRGEYQAYTNLSYLEDSGCRFLFNVYLPTNHGETTEADIILFTKLGLVVIESKNYSGWIFGSEQQANWTQTLPQGRRTQKNRFYNPLWQNHAHILAIANILGWLPPMYSVVAFADGCELKDVTWNTPGTYVSYYQALPAIIEDISTRNDETLSDDDVFQLWGQLYPYSQANQAIKAQHVSDVARKRR